MQDVLIIAEAGVNHNGSLEMAKQMALAAKNAGASSPSRRRYLLINSLGNFILIPHFSFIIVPYFGAQQN